MRTSPVLLAAILSLTGCGSGQGPADTSIAAFDPPPAKEGYVRLKTQTVPDVQPGGDIIVCQYVMAPFDHDVDILNVGGYQSKYGHHAVAFSYTPTGNEVLGETFPCMGSEFNVNSGTSGGQASGSLGAFLGGPAGATDRGNKLLPDGVAFRLKKGDGIMANIHVLNTGDTPVDGNAVIDVQFADPDPSRLIAGVFLNLDMGFSVAPDAKTETSTECVAGSDVKILMQGNHMHDFGVSATTEVVHAGTGAVEVLHDDPQWSSDMQFNFVLTRWGVDDAYVLHAGDTLRTRCAWNNSTADTMTFPREMCIGLGFALTSGDSPKAPGCLNGKWIPKFL